MMKTINTNFVRKFQTNGFGRIIKAEGYVSQTTTHMQACCLIMFDTSTLDFDDVLSQCGFENMEAFRKMLALGTQNSLRAHERVNAFLDINNLISDECIENLSDAEILEKNGGAREDYLLQAAECWEETSSEQLSYTLHGVRYPLDRDVLSQEGVVWWEWLKKAWFENPSKITRWVNACVSHDYLEQGFNGFNQWVMERSEEEKNNIIDMGLEFSVPFDVSGKIVFHEIPLLN